MICFSSNQPFLDGPGNLITVSPGIRRNWWGWQAPNYRNHHGFHNSIHTSYVFLRPVPTRLSDKKIKKTRKLMAGHGRSIGIHESKFSGQHDRTSSRDVFQEDVVPGGPKPPAISLVRPKMGYLVLPGPTTSFSRVRS